MAERPAPYSHFRLNFEQQQKRAKDLLRAARAGDADALARFRSLPPKLSEAQYLIARELRFDDWTHLKRHIAAMTREREALEAIPPSANAATARASAERTSALDGSLRTLHVRCGSDIRQALLDAGFSGDFYEHACDCGRVAPGLAPPGLPQIRTCGTPASGSSGQVVAE